MVDSGGTGWDWGTGELHILCVCRDPKHSLNPGHVEAKGSQDTSAFWKHHASPVREGAGGRQDGCGETQRGNLSLKMPWSRAHQPPLNLPALRPPGRVLAPWGEEALRRPLPGIPPRSCWQALLTFGLRDCPSLVSPLNADSLYFYILSATPLGIWGELESVHIPTTKPKYYLLKAGRSN